MKEYKLMPDVVLRMPLLSIRTITDEEGLSTERMRKLFERPVIREALYLASPALYQECCKWHEGTLESADARRIELTLLKYFSRMSSRCTPFGTFASIGIGHWSSETNVIVDETSGQGKHTRLDMHYLSALAIKIGSDPPIANLLRFYPNDTIYAFGDELRYIEFTYLNTDRSYTISAVAAMPSVATLLKNAQQGATLRELAAGLTSDDIDLEEATEFVQSMVSNQLLVNDIEPAVSGEEFLDQLLARLASLTSGADAEGKDRLLFYLGTLKEVQEKLSALDSNSGQDIERYEDIARILEKFAIPIDKKQLFQVDTAREFKSAAISNKYAGQIRKAVAFVRSFTYKPTGTSLARFRDSFANRYETQEIPLLEALDNESGIPYSQSYENDPTPIVDDIPQPAAAQDGFAPLTRARRVMMTKLFETLQQGGDEVVLDDADFAGMENQEILPDTFSVMGSILYGPVHAGRVLLKMAAGGSSAVTLFGRFTHAHPGIDRICKELTSLEEALHPEQLLAEIVHIPQARVGNIIARKAFRRFEIPILTRSSSDDQIALSDLMVSVQKGHVVLRSKKYGREVIPRLGTAHNFFFNSLPIYHFLCDLQAQDVRPGIQVTWDMFGIFLPYRPRIRYGDVILQRAVWQFSAADLKPLFGKTGMETNQAFVNWRTKWKLPRFVQLIEGDNELLVDLESPSFRKLLISEMRGKTSVTINEYLHDEGGLITDLKGDPYAHEFVVTYGRKEKLPPVVVPVGTLQNIVRKFAPGSEWLFFKVYSGRKTADVILAERIGPLAARLLAEDLADQWFFLRYVDPDQHVRVRFRLKNPGNVGTVIGLFNEALADLLDNGMVQRIMLDTYVREIERYEPVVDLVEKIFFHHSVQAVHFLEQTSSAENHELLRFLFMIRSMEKFLDHCGYSVNDKSAFYTKARKGYAVEFKSDTTTSRHLGMKYKQYLTLLTAVISGDDATLPEEFHPLAEYVNHGDPDFVKTVGLLAAAVPQTSPRHYEIVWSILHMLMNRLARSKARKHEFVLYDLLERYYDAMISRASQKPSKKEKHAELND